jgi:acetylornithine deacetylase/succinyl-diaminopimelate desuccinylase-like protein
LFTCYEAFEAYCFLNIPFRNKIANDFMKLEAPNLEDFFTLLRFPSISTDPEKANDITACAAWVAAYLAESGLHSEIRDTGGHPVVIAKTEHDPAKKTVLIYGHYDVQPVDPVSLWNHDPFEPELHDGIVTARGATDNKGQFFSHMLAIRQQLKENGPNSLPVNVIFLIEGEEEIGSPSLAPFLKANREELACDVILISDTGMIAPETPTFTYGLRGVACMEFTITGPDKDLHSGIFGGAVANPLSEISKLVTGFHHPDGTIAIEGFYDSVVPLEKWEREAWAKLPLHEQEFIDLSGSPELYGEPGYNAFERTFARPTAELNGLFGGYQGEGSKTVLPSKAQAKVSFRIVPDQTPAQVLALAAAHLKQHCPPTVKCEIKLDHSGDPYLVDPNTGYGKAAREALCEVMPGKEPAVIREGGSIPIVSDFKKILGVDSLLLGLALPDCRIHSPNENFPIRNIELGGEINRAVLKAIAKI